LFFQHSHHFYPHNPAQFYYFFPDQVYTWWFTILIMEYSYIFTGLKKVQGYGVGLTKPPTFVHHFPTRAIFYGLGFGWAVPSSG
jgi:hypothetical protein